MQDLKELKKNTYPQENLKKFSMTRFHLMAQINQLKFMIIGILLIINFQSANAHRITPILVEQSIQRTPQSTSKIDIEINSPLFLNFEDEKQIAFLLSTQDQNLNEELEYKIVTSGPIQLIDETQPEGKLILTPNTQLPLKFNTKALDYKGEGKITISLSNSKENVIKEVKIPILPIFEEQSFLFSNLTIPNKNKTIDIVASLPPAWNKRHLRFWAHGSTLESSGLFSRLNEFYDKQLDTPEYSITKLFINSTLKDKINLSGIIKSEEANKVSPDYSEDLIEKIILLYTNNSFKNDWLYTYGLWVLKQAEKNNFIKNTELNTKIDHLFKTQKKQFIKKWQTLISEWYFHLHKTPSLGFIALTLQDFNYDASKDILDFIEKFDFNNYKIKTSTQLENLFFLHFYLLSKNQFASKDLETKIEKQFTQILNLKIKEGNDSSESFSSLFRNLALKTYFTLQLNKPHHTKWLNESINQIKKNFLNNKLNLNPQEIAWGINCIHNFNVFKNAVYNSISVEDSKNLQLQYNSNASLQSFFLIDNIPVWYLEGYDLANSTFKLVKENKPYLKPNLWLRAFGYPVSPPKTLSPLIIQRHYFNLEGDEIDEGQLKVGDEIIVELRVDNITGKTFKNLIIEDYVPSSAVIFDTQINNQETEELKWLNPARFKSEHISIDANQGRIQVYGEIFTKNKYYYYKLKMMGPGSHKVRSAKVQSIYYPEIVSYSSDIKFVITETNPN